MATLPKTVPEDKQSPPNTDEITKANELRLKQLGEILAGTVQKDQLDDKGIKPH